jgi:cyclic-di-AMP phosphodiesterase PgpH
LTTASRGAGSDGPRPDWRMYQSQDIPWPTRLRVFAIWLVVALLMIVILVVRLPLSGQVTLQMGDVAPRDIVAPRQATYVSEIQTEQRRTLAANAVADAYDPPQARIGRQQLILASQILDYITSVRSDSYADPATKTAHIQAIVGLDLPASVINRVLVLPEATWERVAGEVPVVLEQAMRADIRENNLADERRKVAARVRLDLTDEDATVVSEIVQDLLVPNSFFNLERTEERRQTARDAVEPITATVERNEIILRSGDIVTEQDVEALRALGLQQSTWSWQEVRSASSFVLLITGVFLYYLWRQEPLLWLRPRQMLLIASAFIVFTLTAKAMLPARALLPYLLPYAALPIILAIAVNLRVALVTMGLFALIVGWVTAGSLELMAFSLCSALVGALKLRRSDRMVNFAWAALYVLVTNLLVVAVFRIGAGAWDWRGLLELSVASFVNAVITATVILLGLYMVGAIFGITTPVQLMEISRPTHPLLRQLLLKAPGTYHHTLIVSNMSERAAEAIGADALLTRVGAYFHDVGKTIRPYFYVENRTEGVDPHSRLDPYTSAQVIITHVKDGIELARKYRLPERIIEFIPQHQGTLLVSYFYHQAVQQAGSAEAVDQAQFRYPGPRPQTRETAITMLADGAEATVRARHPASIEELEQIVGESIQNRLLSGQLDDCPLTMADLAGIRQAFVDVLRGLHHPRIAYPSDMAARAQETTTQPAVVGQAALVNPPAGQPAAQPSNNGGAHGPMPVQGEQEKASDNGRATETDDEPVF